MAEDLKGTTEFGFRVQGLIIEGLTRDDAKEKVGTIIAELESFGATVNWTHLPRFQPDSPSVATTVFIEEDKEVPVVTNHSLEDFLASSAERFNRFPVKSFWEALVEHTMLAHGILDGRPKFEIEELLFDVPGKKEFYVGMEPCECALRGYGYYGLDPSSIIKVWKQWEEVRPGRLYKFGPRKQAFLGALANRLEIDL